MADRKIAHPVLASCLRLFVRKQIGTFHQSFLCGDARYLFR
jgi:hypothetical protein